MISIANGCDSNRTQNFLYDSPNRISQAYTSGPNWRAAHLYDFRFAKVGRDGLVHQRFFAA